MKKSIDFKSLIKSKEKRRDAAYIVATIAIIVLTAGLFVWSVNIILRAINAAFAVGEKDISSEILSFNLKEFAQIAPLLGINFNLAEKPVEMPPVMLPPAPVLTPEEPATSTSVATSTETSTFTSTSTLTEL